MNQVQYFLSENLCYNIISENIARREAAASVAFFVGIIEAMAKKKFRYDVQWYLPKGKRPIAGSTLSAKLLICLMSREYDTIQQIHDAINYDMEAKNILRIYIDKGYGSVTARDIFE